MVFFPPLHDTYGPSSMNRPAILQLQVKIHHRCHQINYNSFYIFLLQFFTSLGRTFGTIGIGEVYIEFRRVYVADFISPLMMALFAKVSSSLISSQQRDYFNGSVNFTNSEFTSSPSRDHEDQFYGICHSVTRYINRLSGSPGQSSEFHHPL